MTAILFLLLLFPVWWLVIGYFLKCQHKFLRFIFAIIPAGGILGFMIAFACNGGAGGSSQMSGSAWGCLFPYLVIYHLIILFLLLTGMGK
jgi:hypothetical protein